ncbi:MAG TPA: universal stress protein [Pseudonocardiaceae bacterium]|nr:universal stress protein [Pseudonocardiaceae bacterium]
MTEPSGDARRIVVGVDGSTGSRAALAWALRQADLTGASVNVRHVLRHPESLELTVLPTNYGGAPFGQPTPHGTTRPARSWSCRPIRPDRYGGRGSAMPTVGRLGVNRVSSSV